jgi:hypothetical protein
VSMDERIFADARVKAARAGKSLSRYMADLVQADLRSEPEQLVGSTREQQIAALERILSGPKWDLLREGPLPDADGRNERR